jgi:hypothetical protein
MSSSSQQQQQQQQQQQLQTLQSVDLTNFMNSPTSSLKNLLNSLDCSRIFDHKSMPKMQLKQRKESFPVIKFDELDQTIRQKFLTELKNYSTGKKSNVFYFYHDDAFVSNKSLRSKDDDGYDDGYGFKYVPNLNEKRRRVFAYVWVQENGFNYIFYGGCVFNPTKSEKSIPKLRSSATFEPQQIYWNTEDGLNIEVFEIEKMLQWGTPKDLKEYLQWSDYFLKRNIHFNKSFEDTETTLILPMAGAGSRFSKEGYELTLILCILSSIEILILSQYCLFLHIYIVVLL